MLEITKKGRVTKRKTLTKTLNLSKAQKQSAITLIPADIQKAEIIHEGKLYNINDLRGSMRESNQKKEEAQTKKADVCAVENEFGRKAKKEGPGKGLDRKSGERFTAKPAKWGNHIGQED